MTDNDELIIEALDRRVERRNARRDFFRTAGGFAAGAAGAVALTACGGGSSSSTAQTSTGSTNSDPDILNFALNLEYLEAQFYAYAATGTGLPASMLTGTGTAGTLNSTGAGMVPFQDPVVRAYAIEIAKDEAAHVNFLRTALSSAAVAMPSIDISTGPTGAFSTAAQAAGLIAAGQSFSPYASDNNFLLGAYIFEDVGVTAYKGASPLITSKAYLEAAAGILAAEAYHAGLIRTVLYAKGINMPTGTIPTGTVPNSSLIGATTAISNARDSLDGTTTGTNGSDDQGVATTSDGGSNITLLDPNGVAYSRSVGQVLNIVYLTKASTTKGGFFPNGVNGIASFATSAASG